MSLHFYRGGTTGGTDGVELSSGSDSTPLLFDGLFPALGDTTTAQRTLHIRADAGEVWRFVHVSIRGSSHGQYYLAPTVRSSGEVGLAHIIGQVGDVNVPIIVTASALGTELGYNDNACDIYAWGVPV